MIAAGAVKREKSARLCAERNRRAHGSGRTGSMVISIAIMLRYYNIIAIRKAGPGSAHSETRR